MLSKRLFLLLFFFFLWNFALKILLMQNSSEQLFLLLLFICIANMSLAAFILDLHFLVIAYSE